MSLLLLHLLNVLQVSALIFLLAVGLTIIFGLMDTLNLAHGAFLTLGAYAGVVITEATGSYWIALLGAPVLPFLAGAALQFFVLQPLKDRGRSSHLDLALLSFGLLFAMVGSIEWFFGPSFVSIATPPALSGHVAVFGNQYPIYRLFMIAAGLGVALVLWLLVERTLVGAILRAGVDRPEMAMALGINLKVMFAVVFGLGCALAGFAGVIAAPVMSVYAHLGTEMLVISFVVVMIGGLGSIRGSFYASLIVGLVNTMSQAYVPGGELFAIYALLIVIMIWRPQGLFTIDRRIA
ncbi:branched-chain amino acid ABC transporter permease [Caenimonas soli]|uniref:branched-chain amino acid ABC transporter permease n=1 Tax=Caenimonas soli TaxID=2735555 RepID=UPI0015560392|nr:branched-chain amino acid ABC transporter permease [Caenimonas soli]NPC59147.1 branched-chain amino acid ABC transporter permease [Caenimonas soli]